MGISTALFHVAIFDAPPSPPRALRLDVHAHVRVLGLLLDLVLQSRRARLLLKLEVHSLYC
jgi:hypothetical protein